MATGSGRPEGISHFSEGSTRDRPTEKLTYGFELHESPVVLFANEAVLEGCTGIHKATVSAKGHKGTLAKL
jgi:hypothetical protein